MDDNIYMSLLKAFFVHTLFEHTFFVHTHMKYHCSCVSVCVHHVFLHVQKLAEE